MPIRFRCAYCNQLMAIAHRKAGSVVRCPKCAGELIVPTPPDAPAPSAGNGSDEINISAILEQADVEREFASPPEPPPEATHTATAAATSRPVAVDTLPGGLPDPVPTQPSVFLPRRMLVVAVVLGLLILGTAFVAGFVAGRWSGHAAAPAVNEAQ
jgi:hypothetical protein